MALSSYPFDDQDTTETQYSLLFRELQDTGVVDSFGGTSFHATSTCRMGTDAMAVVDPALRVAGVAGLRVIDASIMPTVVSGNTNAAAIMIGEKGADLLRAA